jgi:plastocyanin
MRTLLIAVLGAVVLALGAAAPVSAGKASERAGRSKAHCKKKPRRCVRRKQSRVARRDEAVRLTPRAPVVPPVKPPVDPPTVPKPLTRVQVLAREFSLTLSRPSVAAGVVAVELNNRGEDPHDLRLERAGSSDAFGFAPTGPESVSTLKFDMRPGTWKLYCTLEGHEALGMSATLTVAE